VRKLGEKDITPEDREWIDPKAGTEVLARAEDGSEPVPHDQAMQELGLHRPDH
jgi:hypothetical protein